MSFRPSEALRKLLDHELEVLPTKRAASVSLLLAIQEENGHVSPEAEEWVAEVLELPLVKVRELVSFYTMLKSRPQGRQHIRVCRNISCSLMGADRLIAHMEESIGCAPGRRTRDGELSWETVECLGACEMAPMLQWDADFLGPLTVGGFDEEYRRRVGDVSAASNGGGSVSAAKLEEDSPEEEA